MKTTRKEAEQTPRRLILPKEFSKECYLVDFEKEYGKDNGIPERWGIATELTSDGLERKYGAFLNPYRPFRIMRWEEGAVIAAFLKQRIGKQNAFSGKQAVSGKTSVRLYAV